jgi:hypothetical protein
MALDRLTEDMNFIGSLGDDPKRDDGLSTPQFKSFFDKAGLVIQNFINNKLIPQIERSIDEGALLQQISEVLGRKLDKSGGTMYGPINMNGQKLTGMNSPKANDEPATKGYVDGTKLTATLQASAWYGSSAPYTQTVSVPGVMEDDDPDYWPVYSGSNETCIAQKDAFAVLDRLTTANGSITVTCFEEKPDVDLTIEMEVYR